MTKAMKSIHLFGLVSFLGSIFSFTAISIIVKNGNFGDLFFSRQIIDVGTRWLTIPGICMLLVSGIFLSLNLFREKKWVQLKMGIMVIIILNTYFFIVPAADQCLKLAEQAVSSGVLSPYYENAAKLETISGIINVLLALLASGLGVFKPK